MSLECRTKAVAVRPLVIALGISALLCSLSVAQTQTDSQDSDAQSSHSSLIDYLSRTVKLSGSIRERLEATHGSNFSVTPADAYMLSQIRFGLNFHPISWLTFFGQAQDARALFYDTKPSGSIADPFDLRQAYAAVGKREGNGGLVEFGRQEITIGSGRLINSTDTWWANSARTFDVVRGTWTSNFVKTDVVAGSVENTDPLRMDRHKPGDHVYAEYNTFTHLLSGGTIEPYFFARTLVGVKGKDGHVGDMDTLAAGGRVAGKAIGLDYSFEAVHEAGGYADDQIRANALAAFVGWTISKSYWAPRISSDYAYASGDNGAKDGGHETFDNMYGSNQPLNSLTGLFGWRNIKDWRSGVEVHPAKKLSVKVDYRDYWLASTQDGLYNSAGSITVLNTKALNAHVGQGIETMTTIAVSKTMQMGFGVGNLFPGAYLKESNKTSGFIYPVVYVTKKF